MKVSYNYGNRAHKAVAIIMIIVYLIIAVALPVMNRNGNVLLNGSIPISGILGAVQFGLALVMTALEYQIGGTAAIVLCGFSFSTAVISSIKARNGAAIPGLCYYIACIVAVIIIKNQLARERKNSLIDGLTGISNRKNIIQHIDYLISKNIPFFVLFLDLDNFKMINDTQGYEVGDGVLVDLVNQWKHINEKQTSIGRFGGDKFIVVVKKSGCDDVIDLANQYINVVKRKSCTEEWLMSNLTMSVGIVAYPDHSKKVNELVRKADITVHKAQSSGRNMCVIYDPDFEKKIIREQYIEERVRKALEKSLFYMVYQPQYYADSHELRGFESLIRMKTEGEPPLYPGDFIPVAEKSDMIIEIGEFVLREVTAAFSPIFAANSSLVLSVNISAKQMMSKDFINVVRKALDDSGFNPANLEIEITEYCLMDTTEEAVRVIEGLKKLGIKLAMDDFGTGYSSLSYLNRLPIDLIKIDKSIVDEMGNGEVVGAICSMGHALSCEIIAEGVEEQEQLQILREKGCDLIQGFIWGRPIPFDEATELI